MSVPHDLFCVLGPSKMFSREIVLCTIDGGRSWSLPCRKAVDGLLCWLDLPAFKVSEVVSYGEHRVTAHPCAPSVGLDAAVLEERRFTRLQGQFEERGVKKFKLITFGQVVAKKACFDLQTYGALSYLFYNFDR